MVDVEGQPSQTGAATRLRACDGKVEGKKERGENFRWFKFSKPGI